VGSSAEGDEVALVNWDDAVSSESEDDEVRVKAATVKRSSDADEDADALRPDTDAVDEREDALMVEFENWLSDAGMDAGMMLLPGTLVGAGEGIAGTELMAAARAAEEGEANGYGGTVRSLGNGGTEGTTGRATVGIAGTDGTCGKDGTAAAGDANGSAAFTTAETTGAAAESTALTAAGTTAASDGEESRGASTAAVLVSWPTRFPLESTVATTSTATVKTFVGDAAWRRW
jgi:hypothetical protein